MRRFVPIVMAVVLGNVASFALPAQDAAPDNDPLHYEGPPRKQDEVLLISTRDAPEPARGEVTVEPLKRLDIRRWSEADAWEPLNLDAFLADDSGDVTTIVYVHGYGFDEEKARRVGWAFYHAVCEGLPARQRVRCIIWSWPTEAVRFRPTRDVAEKSRRADADAVYLARLLQDMHAKPSVCVIGSALGCRVVEGALHLLGGGDMAGWKLPRRNDAAVPRVHAAFISPAVHDDWLYDGQFHDRAVAGAARLLLINNSLDSTLRRYSMIWRSRPSALGLDGIRHANKLGEFAERIEQYDAHEQIGDNHGVEHYLRAESIVERLHAFLSAATE